MEERRISFLGDLLIIIVIVFFVFLFLNQTKTNNINQVVLINQEFGVTKHILVPYDASGYIAKLSSLSEKQVTENLIEFTLLTTEISEVEGMLYRASIVREECASRDLKLKINAVYLKTERLEKSFSEMSDKKYDKLNIDSYMLYLSNVKKTYFTYKTDIEKATTCK